MRHVYGIGLAIVMILVMFFAGAWGYLRLLRLPPPAAALPAQGGSLLPDNGVLVTLAAVAATGLVAGILIAVPRISPLAAGLPGLLLIAWTVLYLVSVRRAVGLIPLRSDAFGAGWEGMLFNGVLGGAGLAMIIPLFLPSRWRSAHHVQPDSEMSEAREFIADLKDSPEPEGSPRLVPSDAAGSRPAGSGARPAGSRPAGSRPAGSVRPEPPWTPGSSPDR